MLVECEKCGAPLPVKRGARTCECGYCKSVNVVETLRTLALEVPSGWKPPKTWTPPPGFEVQGTLKYAGAAALGVSGLVVLGVVGFLLFMVLSCLGCWGVMYAISPDTGDRPWIEGPGFTEPWPDGPPPRDRHFGDFND